MIRVLVACEYSGIVREEFRKLGNDAWSCDLLPTEIPGKHFQTDIFNVIDLGWDLMIAHPPCTYLSNAGIRWFDEDKYGDKARQRKKLREEAFQFVLKLANANIPRICIENPVGYLNTHWRKPDQIIQPYYFGDTDSKRTCLWLKNLPKLRPTNIVKPEVYGFKKNGEPIYWHEYLFKLPQKERAKVRSKTFKGIARAMAQQWSKLPPVSKSIFINKEAYND